jgi:hypothetical protein
MNREEKERMLDRVLDDALAPQNMEPRPGLEQRILANLRAQPEPQPWWRWRLLLVPASVAVLVLLMVLLRQSMPSPPLTAPIVVEQNVKSPPPPPTKETPLVAHRPSARPRTHPMVTEIAKAPAQEPRPPVFAPARLTEGERALYAMLRSNPDEATLVTERQEKAQQEAAEFMEQAFKPQQ